MRRLLIAILLPATVNATDLTGRIVGVHDGDTVTLLDAQHQQHKIRFAGIDAPELKQAFGQVSKRNLSDLVYGRDVSLGCGKTDKYKRLVCLVMVDGVDANLAQVKAGLAWHNKKYEREQARKDREDYATAENSARAERLGLWADANPIPPWEWRVARRSGATPNPD